MEEVRWGEGRLEWLGEGGTERENGREGGKEEGREGGIPTYRPLRWRNRLQSQ